jgi:3',5'-cyclic AMP phosphodiesterase CpdA
MDGARLVHDRLGARRRSPRVQTSGPSRRRGYASNLRHALVVLGVCIVAAGCGASRPGAARRPVVPPLVVRTELAPRSPVTHVLATFAQITDAHVTDEESPVRVEPLDRLAAPFTSAFRPQEALTGQLLDAAVVALDRQRPSAVVVTGDLIDNDQSNELAEALGVLRGGWVDPNSGGPGYQGVQQASNPDPFVYRPAVDPPRHAALLQAAERRFHSRGLSMPWYPLVGNHEVLVQGNLAPTVQTERLAIGDRKVVAFDAAALEAAQRRRLDPAVVRRILARGLPGPSIRVAPDPRRRELHPREVLDRLRAASGHGGSGPWLDYAFPLGRGAVGIALDVVSRTEGSRGVVHPGQAAWLGRALARAGRRPVVVFSHQPLPSVAGGGAVLAELDQDPHVVAAVAGDTHRNSIVPRRTAAGGYWLITTSSLVDWPQQTRMFRMLATRRGVELETWTVNPDPSVPLAGISRQLAWLDYQGGRPQRFAGRPSDRNAALYR